MSNNQEMTVREIYNQVASDYDHPTSFYFQDTADLMLKHVGIQPETRLLDVCTGTGFLALSAANQYPTCHVTGIDISEGMIKKANSKAEKLSLSNVTFHQMDLNELDLENDRYDVSLCNYGLHFLDKMDKGLGQMRLKTKEHGKVVFSVFDTNAFAEPVAMLKADYQAFRERLGRDDIPQWKAASSSWKTLAKDESIIKLCHQSGLEKVVIKHDEQGFVIKDPANWWDIIWNSSYRHMLQNFTAEELASFKEIHLGHFRELGGQEGYWLDTSSIIVIAEKASGRK